MTSLSPRHGVARTTRPGPRSPSPRRRFLRRRARGFRCLGLPGGRRPLAGNRAICSRTDGLPRRTAPWRRLRDARVGALLPERGGEVERDEADLEIGGNGECIGRREHPDRRGLSNGDRLLGLSPDAETYRAPGSGSRLVNSVPPGPRRSTSPKFRARYASSGLGGRNSGSPGKKRLSAAAVTLSVIEARRPSPALRSPNEKLSPTRLFTTRALGGA